jgi:hypothetical protein
MTDEEFTRTIDNSRERGGIPSIQKSRDQDKAKGATEQTERIKGAILACRANWAIGTRTRS